MVQQPPYTRRDTPQKFNMEPEDDGFQKESPLQGGHFQVLCLFWGVYMMRIHAT